jgi:hypothetical protein
MAGERSAKFLLVAGALVVALVVGRLWAEQADLKPAREDAKSSEKKGMGATRYSVHISRPNGPPRVSAGNVDALGQPVTVSCASCHANLQPDADRSASLLPTRFHQGLRFQHGELRCHSCHNAPAYSELRRADGRAIDFANVQTLCSQCHSPQAVDYEHGAHGGMNGYWDLTRGPRQRKGCTDCHDPHSPAFPTMAPTFKPYDRFLPRESGEGHE